MEGGREGGSGEGGGRQEKGSRSERVLSQKKNNE